jgi:hypothetical protein
MRMGGASQDLSGDAIARVVAWRGRAARASLLVLDVALAVRDPPCAAAPPRRRARQQSAKRSGALSRSRLLDRPYLKATLRDRKKPFGARGQSAVTNP